MVGSSAPTDVKRHEYCIMCGELNQLSLHLKFRPDPLDGVSATFRGNYFLQGYDGILHGGVISALLDSAMTHCLFSRNIEAVTGELMVRFVSPIPCNSELTVRGWLVRATPPLYLLGAQVLLAGSVMAEADAKFMRRSTGDGCN